MKTDVGSDHVFLQAGLRLRPEWLHQRWVVGWLDGWMAGWVVGWLVVGVIPLPPPSLPLLLLLLTS